MKTTLKRPFQLLLTATVLSLSLSLSAQEQQTTAESGMSPKFGVKAGLNLSNFYNDDVNDNNMKAGLNAGVFAKLPVTRGLSIQPELLYSNKGSKTSYNNFLQGEGEYRMNLHYVELPVLAVINLAPNFSLQAGPYVSYLAGANIKDLNEDGSIEEIAELNADDLSRFDYGLTGGLGVDIQNFTIGARYNLGLGDIGKSGSLTGEAFKGVKNSNISIYVGVGF